MGIKVKICGITRFEDAWLSAKLGADFLGFNFYKKSKRYIQPENAKEIINSLSDFNSKTVGVFVNHSKDEVLKIQEKVGLNYLQFHGDETKDFISSFLTSPLNLKIIKAVRIKNHESTNQTLLNNLIKLKKENSNLTLLFDSFSKEYGGSGKRINEPLLDELKSLGLLENSFLAGGLTPNNVTQLLEKYKPFAVDVASGVEKEPGIKSKEILKSFFESLEKA